MKQIDIPEFGDTIPGQKYVSRPGAYALLLSDQGRVAVMQTPRGCYLPGGGTEGNETPEETLVREIREECGFSVRSVRRVSEAVEYVFSVGNEFGIRKECVFFASIVDISDCGTATEADHTLIWMEPQEAAQKLAHRSQQWAVGQLRQI